LTMPIVWRWRGLTFHSESVF